MNSHNRRCRIYWHSGNLARNWNQWAM